MPVSLRLAHTEDAEAVASIYAPYVQETAFTFEYEAPTPAEMARRMAEKHGVFPWLVAQQDGRVLGYAYAGRLGARRGYDWACEVSIYTAQSARHHGLGKALYTALLALLAAQGYHIAVGILAIPNPASQSFHQKMGFVPQGLLENVGYKFGKPQSVGYYAKALHPAVENPLPPLPLSQLKDTVIQDILHRAVQGIGVSPK